MAQRRTAIAIFEALGAAEAKIHNIDIEKVHFHEVGAVDAMVDIICSAVGAEALGVDEIVCSPLNVGGGTREMRAWSFACAGPGHGGVVAGRAGLFLRHSGGTGHSDGRGDRQDAGQAVRAVSGDDHREIRIWRRQPRLSRPCQRGSPDHWRVAGRICAENTSQETISVLEANLDDLNPQVFGYVVERLLEAGALDTFAVPVQMKKNRPGMLLTVLSKPEDAPKLTQIIFTETSTLGVRRREEQRQTLARKWINVVTRWGDVRLKIASMNGTITNYAPEYEDCKKIAAENRVPLKSVMNEAMEAYWKALKS